MRHVEEVCDVYPASFFLGQIFDSYLFFFIIIIILSFFLILFSQRKKKSGAEEKCI